MKKERFISIIKEELEIDEAEFNSLTRFDSLEFWDSMSRLILISLADENFQIQLRDSDFQSIQTINDLVKKIGEDRFEEL